MKRKSIYILTGIVLACLIGFIFIDGNSYKDNETKSDVKIHEPKVKSKVSSKDEKKKNETKDSSKKKEIKESVPSNQKSNNENIPLKKVKNHVKYESSIKNDSQDVVTHEPIHQHNFKYVKPVTKKVIDVAYVPAWDEPIYELVVHYVCNGCGIRLESYEKALEHVNENMLNGDPTHSYSDNAYNEIVGYIHHEEILEQSHMEIVEQGYHICECGMKK